MYILFDVGGSKMRIAGTDDCKEFTREPIVVKTPQDFDEGVSLLKDKIYEIASGEKIDGIAGGIAGPFDKTTHLLVGGPNLKDWIRKPLYETLENTFHTTVQIENDSALVGLGEMHYGKGCVEGVGAYITVSTGVGGARFIDGHIDRAATGFEPGKQIIDPTQTLFPNLTGSLLEDLISGKATEERLHTKPYDILQTDTLWDQYAKVLAYGLNNTIVHWSPDAVVLGGSMIVGNPRISIEKTEEYLKETLTVFPTLPEIHAASLSDLGGLYGAMVLLRESKK